VKRGKLGSWEDRKMGKAEPFGQINAGGEMESERRDTRYEYGKRPFPPWRFILKTGSGFLYYFFYFLY
jgi:hypothetical protein